ncbi:anthranilate phosphoribosyltransferase [Ignatzschineria sp. F8392]|uniref:anthranilate phosphoribosyltransferase n=1 Tax=Ignatzschineria sp. F8392 TaxID=1980117 RepID=UPI000B97ED1E|nr:anthranilate phosphoribosyltransferase [Ignatzschineria sp. F8392]OYQ81698.1 anthranilate phosphoribosyltransferase [Ignatzschineria sp. F8392]
MTDRTNTSLKPIFQRLYSGERLSQEESHQLFSTIARGEVSEALLGAALISMKLRGETPAEVAGAASAFLSEAKYFDTPDYPFADIVGTGGDGLNTVNISTASALVGASCGAIVAKHGNRSVSSLTGSSDLLQALGVDLYKSPEEARTELDQARITFLFAPHYHGGFKYAAKTRGELKTRTIFNLLGPLTNPARPKRAVMGVYHADLTELMAETAKLLGYEHVLVVHGGGMDEAALHAPTKVTELRDGLIETYSLTPADFGLNEHPLSAIRGGDALENRKTLLTMLHGAAPEAHRHAVAINVALLLKLFGYENLKENAENALTAIDERRALALLEKMTGNQFTQTGEIITSTQGIQRLA